MQSLILIATFSLQHSCFCDRRGELVKDWLMVASQDQKIIKASHGP